MSKPCNPSKRWALASSSLGIARVSSVALRAPKCALCSLACSGGSSWFARAWLTVLWLCVGFGCAVSLAGQASGSNVHDYLDERSTRFALTLPILRVFTLVRAGCFVPVPSLDLSPSSLPTAIRALPRVILSSAPVHWPLPSTSPSAEPSPLLIAPRPPLIQSLCWRGQSSRCRHLVFTMVKVRPFIYFNQSNVASASTARAIACRITRAIAALADAELASWSLSCYCAGAAAVLFAAGAADAVRLHLGHLRVSTAFSLRPVGGSRPTPS